MYLTIGSYFAADITLTFSADLEIVGTALKYQRQESGSMLIQHGCEQAGEQGFQVFLEAAPEALRLYLRFSFRGSAETHTWIQNGQFSQGEIYTETFMIRQPRTE
jgi:ribosomal protein S18 acetylase RimI-like enzyme